MQSGPQLAARGQVKVKSSYRNVKCTNIYMLFAGWEVRIVKNCDRGLAFSSPRSQFFTIRTDPKPVNKLFIFF